MRIIAKVHKNSIKETFLFKIKDFHGHLSLLYYFAWQTKEMGRLEASTLYLSKKNICFSVMTHSGGLGY